MKIKTGITAAVVLLFFIFAYFAEAAEPELLLSSEMEFSSVLIEPAKMGVQKGLAVNFTGTEGLHYYASKSTAPMGLNLKVSASAEGAVFGEAVLPEWELFQDNTQGKEVEVYAGEFTVFMPLESYDESAERLEAEVTIKGIACTSSVCLPPFEKKLKAAIAPASAEWKTIDFAAAEVTADEVVEGASYSIFVYLMLALAAGLSFNIMPCVLPVIPLIIMRLVEQSKENKEKRISSGIAFCGGIILFFAAFAAVTVILKLTTGAVFNWSDQLRYPAFVTAMGLLLIVLGLFMFDVFAIAIPASVAGKSGSGKGAAGSIGMGFLAALLSTPCSGAILAAVLIWAQTQPLVLSTLAIILMGIGMTLPYAALIAMPSLLQKIPKPGTWMEIFRKSMGFLLIFIAVKLLGALPKEMLVHVLYYAAVLSFCVWMWGSWVNFSTPVGKKWAIRMLAVIIAVVMGMWLLPQKEKLIDWADYDAAAVNSAKQNGRAVLIKFTADWCTNCAVLESRVYDKEDVAAVIREKNILPVKADTTSIDFQATKDMKSIYNEPGNVPLTVIISPGGNITKLRGIFQKEKLLSVLEEM